jgi:hypothetical protein
VQRAELLEIGISGAKPGDFIAIRAQAGAKLQSSRKSQTHRVTALAARRLWFKLAGMKLCALFVKSLFIAASLGAAGSLLAQGAYGAKPKQPSSDAAKNSADNATIPGVTIPRANGGFLGLEIDSNSNFKLSFYGADKKPTAPDVASGSIQWRPINTGRQEFVSLSPGGDGTSLTSPKVVRHPWTFKLSISLFVAGNNNPVESYTVDYSE